MLPEIRSALSAERACDLQSIGCRERMARAAAAARINGPRQRLGRRLVSIGSRIAGEDIAMGDL